MTYLYVHVARQKLAMVFSCSSAGNNSMTGGQKLPKCALAGHPSTSQLRYDSS